MRELAAAGYGPEAYLRIITGQIGRIGWAVQGVPGDEQWPSWAYSIGLWHTFRVPELALFGLSLPNMAAGHQLARAPDRRQRHDRGR